jgi:hypothetical protein
LIKCGHCGQPLGMNEPCSIAQNAACGQQSSN